MKNLRKLWTRNLVGLHHIVMDYFNAKIGARSINDNMKCTGPFGIVNRNESGERLVLHFAEEDNLVIFFSYFVLSKGSKQILTLYMESPKGYS